MVCSRRTALLLCSLLPSGARAQVPIEWNSPAALELIARARDARQRVSMDPDLRSYQAEATGRVFFLVDRPDTERRTLIKADQIALELYWLAPRQTRQRIVGLRDQEMLPTNIRYHLDHLTVVQDDFGDRIRLGDGDEVESVVHPTAPGAESIYDYRLGDSLTIRFPGTGLEVRVNEVQVRPKHLDLPGFVGSVYLDRANAAIVRMNFTFTPASYVDRYLDYIRISLDNSLWEGRWWLPFRQDAEIRREMPALDFLAGSVIRGRFEISDYTFNLPLPNELFMGTPVTAVPETEREAYPFEEPLIPEEMAAELSPTPSLQEVRARALELTAGRYLSGLAPLRVYAPSASHVFRWNRAESAFLGLGMVWRPSGRGVVKANGGWAFGRDEPSVAVSFERPDGRVGVRAAWNELRDLGPFPGASGTLNTFSALTGGEDWLDPWFSTGVTASFSASAWEPSGKNPVRIALIWERHDSAQRVLDEDDALNFRPLPTVREGWFGALEVRHEPNLSAPLEFAMTGRVALFDADGQSGVDALGALLASLVWERAAAGPRLRLLTRLDAGLALGEVPPQQLFFLGGRAMLPGHPYRAQVGDAFWLARVDATRPLLHPWLTAHAFIAAGAASRVGDSVDTLVLAGSDTAAGVRASAGVGLGLGWDVLHLDLGRGLDGGEWELVVSVDRRFRGWL